MRRVKRRREGDEGLGMKKGVKGMRRGLVWAMILGMTAGLWGQEGKAPLTVRIDQIISRGFPDLRAYAVIESAGGEVVAGLSPGLFQFRIDSLEAATRTRVTPFSMQEEPIDYSIIFSANGIMEGEPLDFQKTALLQFIDAMKENDSLSLYTIGEEAAVLFETQAKSAIDPGSINAATVSQAQPRVYDSLINVLRKAVRRETERKVIILISDGRDQGSRFTREQLGAVLSEAGIPVYSIGIRVLNTQSLSNLNEIADSTGGAYIYARNIKDIPESLKKITQKITQSYIIDLRVRGIPADDLPHTLELTLDERDAYGKGLKTFIAVRTPVPPWVKWAAAGAAAGLIILCVILHVLRRIRKRRRMGITRRRCPDCKKRMKDSWDFCPFCKYMPVRKKAHG
jgi:hypothetical protein